MMKLVTMIVLGTIVFDLQVQVLLLSIMTFNKLIRKDFLFRFNYLLLEIEYKILRSISSNKLLPLSVRLLAIHNLNFLKSTKIRNICIYTGRARGIIKKFGLSRFVFRSFADSGYIPGLRRAS